jgi:hypothetical protein
VEHYAVQFILFHYGFKDPVGFLRPVVWRDLHSTLGTAEITLPPDLCNINREEFGCLHILTSSCLWTSQNLKRLRNNVSMPIELACQQFRLVIGVCSCCVLRFSSLPSHKSLHAAYTLVSRFQGAAVRFGFPNGQRIL